MPLKNDGSVGTSYAGFSVRYDSITVMNESGFFLSGYIADILWSRGSFLLEKHFIPGSVNRKHDVDYKFYTIRSSDTSFGLSWQNWKKAVEQGAYFYDGNNNNVYDPVDLNGNGIWDENEDRPDLIGDYTTWCVVNDGRNDYKYFNSLPIGVEVNQTIFAFSPTTNPQLDNVIFARYILQNKNPNEDILDSVYFGLAVDPDIGDYVDDRMGSDSLLNFGYGYNHGEDEKFGINPPAVLVDLLQGAQSSFSNDSYIDNNSNGIFDEELDTPLDSTTINFGPFLGQKVIRGSTSLSASSIVYLGRSAGIRPPDNKVDVRNYLLGFKRNGEKYDPCTFGWGNLEELEDCEKINPNYVFSGNPVTGEGWLNIWHQDTYFIISTGPFRLEPGKPQTIIAAYIVGRGVDSLHSITVAKEIDEYVQEFYDNNFQEPPVKVETQTNVVPREFKLSQNYPNPFNPSTTVKYQIPKNERRKTINVRLTVYDVLGREVTTLVNERKPPGNYEVLFNVKNLSSGMYFYELRSGNFREVKKMLLLR